MQIECRLYSISETEMKNLRKRNEENVPSVPEFPEFLWVRLRRSARYGGGMLSSCHAAKMEKIATPPADSLGNSEPGPILTERE